MSPGYSESKRRRKLESGRKHFHLEPIEPLDARRGFKRVRSEFAGVEVNGEGLIIGDYPAANMDMWWTPVGRLVVRIRCRDDKRWFEVRSVQGKALRITDRLRVWLHDELMDWLLQYIDEEEIVSPGVRRLLDGYKPTAPRKLAARR